MIQRAFKEGFCRLQDFGIGLVTSERDRWSDPQGFSFLVCDDGGCIMPGDMQWKLFTCLALVTSIISLCFALSAETRAKRAIQRVVAAERAELEHKMIQLIASERIFYTNSLVSFVSGHRGTRNRIAPGTDLLYPVIPPRVAEGN